jgi:hypothetical protein
VGPVEACAAIPGSTCQHNIPCAPPQPPLRPSSSSSAVRSSGRPSKAEGDEKRKGMGAGWRRRQGTAGLRKSVPGRESLTLSQAESLARRLRRGRSSIIPIARASRDGPLSSPGSLHSLTTIPFHSIPFHSILQYAAGCSVALLSASPLLPVSFPRSFSPSLLLSPPLNSLLPSSSCC